MIKFLAAVFILIALQAVPVLAGEITVTIDGAAVQFEDQRPIISGDRTLVPVRGVFERLGFYVTWEDSTRTATLYGGGYLVEITQDSAIFYVNGATHFLDVPAQNIGDRILLPLRAVVEAVGHSVDWDAATQTVLIETAADLTAQWFATAAAVTTIAGTGLPGYQNGEFAAFYLPGAVFGGETGLIIADTHNNLIREVEGGVVATLAGNTIAPGYDGFPRGRHVDGAVSDAFFNRPTGIAISSDGNIFVADSANDAIRTIVGGNVYTFATGFNRPYAIAFGSCGNLFVADALNHVIRAVSPTGEVSEIAGVLGESGYANGTDALFDTPMGIAVDEDGTIFVADAGNHVVRVIEDGYVRTLAGVRTLSAEFDNEPIGGFANGAVAMFSLPVGIALWRDNVIVADSGNNMIRMITPDGYTMTIAGAGYAGHEDGSVASAEFHLPRGVFVRGNNLYIADTGNNLIRRLTLNENILG